LPNLAKLSLDEHVQIANALRDSKVDTAIEIVSRHIKRARELMRGLKEAAPVNVGKMKHL
jgi:DNA-binding FadR family transcriptional regulator